VCMHVCVYMCGWEEGRIDVSVFCYDMTYNGECILLKKTEMRPPMVCYIPVQRHLKISRLRVSRPASGPAHS
jgi:hypothetical protein